MSNVHESGLTVYRGVHRVKLELVSGVVTRCEEQGTSDHDAVRDAHASGAFNLGEAPSSLLFQVSSRHPFAKTALFPVSCRSLFSLNVNVFEIVIDADMVEFQTHATSQASGAFLHSALRADPPFGRGQVPSSQMEKV